MVAETELSLALDDATRRGLYAPGNEHDACGVGFVANIKGKSSPALTQQPLLILQNLDHRGAVGADPLCGPVAGILIHIPDPCYRAALAKHRIVPPPPARS